MINDPVSSNKYVKPKEPASKKEKEKILSDLVSQIKKVNPSILLSDSENIHIAYMAYISKIRPNLNSENPLSITEMLCIILLAIGNNPEKCADLLGISVKTIKTYEQRIRDKLGAKNRTNAFYIALVKGYITIVN